MFYMSMHVCARACACFGQEGGSKKICKNALGLTTLLLGCTVISRHNFFHINNIWHQLFTKLICLTIDLFTLMITDAFNHSQHPWKTITVREVQNENLVYQKYQFQKAVVQRQSYINYTNQIQQIFKKYPEYWKFSMERYCGWQKFNNLNNLILITRK